jgi:hypothetical protein
MYCYLQTHHEFQFLYFTDFYSNLFSVRNNTSCSKYNLSEKSRPLFLPTVELLIGRVNPTFSYVCPGFRHINDKRFLTSGDKHISICKNMTSKLPKIIRFIHWRGSNPFEFATENYILERHIRRARARVNNLEFESFFINHYSQEFFFYF